MMEDVVTTVAEEPGFQILGIKISYNKAFGILFLVIFLLLFFPGIGISSPEADKDVDGKNIKE